jgi:NADH-quinone oxidoreductase subunit K
MSIELLLLSVNLNFASFSVYLDDVTGQIFILFVLAIAAAESASGIAVITAFYKLKNSVQFESVKKITIKV